MTSPTAQPLTFEEFLETYSDKQIALVPVLYDGETRFYAFPKGTDGKTVDFLVTGNALTPLPFGANSMERTPPHLMGTPAQTEVLSLMYDWAANTSIQANEPPAPPISAPGAIRFANEPADHTRMKALELALQTPVNGHHPPRDVIAVAAAFEKYIKGGQGP